ncbi:peptidoglycan editing factor PgeF [Pseudothioglobus sp. nBUS_23]|uniref:peptidoglycan editing factor PgeF n=1 Tax=Pseudothioglobus sp. nBUS_23 TaxID=3395318 RepID=UPI003EB7D57F
MDGFPKNVKLISTQRFIHGGRSSGNFNNFNLALHVNDNKENVIENRNILEGLFNLPSSPVWINQVHSSICIDAALTNTIIEADASFTSRVGIVCGIMTADCLPVFVSKKNGTMVGLAHAGWRGLVSGVIDNLIKSFNSDGEHLIVHLGPAISKHYFEVGEEVMRLYLSKNVNFERSFLIKNNKIYLDLYDAAKVILEGLHINSISGGDRCTFHESEDFFSYRRDGLNSGRMAHLIWME